MDTRINIDMDITESANALLKSSAKSVGGVSSTVIDFFHNTLLYPMQKYNIKVKTNLERYEKQLKKGLENIPKEYIAEPNMNIWGQAMESLRWNFDDGQKYIRDMFANLLLKDLDSRVKNKVLPAYIDIVKQLSEQDAVFLRDLCKQNRSNSISTIEFRWVKANGEYLKIPNERLILLTDLGKIMTPPPEVLDNLERLKIINIHSNEYLTKDRVKCENIFEGRKNRFPIPKGFEKTIFNQGKLDITEFGQGFIKICLYNRDKIVS